MLTNRQADLLSFIEWSLSRDGRPPSHKALRRYLGVRATSSVIYYLDELESKGYIRRDRYRGITILRTLGMPTAAPAYFPYRDHRTVAEVWAELW